MRPEVLWRLSRRAHAAGHHRRARVLKALNFALFRCVLPPEVEVTGEVTLLHRGQGVVLHPSVRITGPVMIAHNVTLGAGDDLPDPHPRIALEPNSFVGANAVVLARRGRSIRVGARAAVGAGALVVSDVPDATRVAAPEAVAVSRADERAV